MSTSGFRTKRPRELSDFLMGLPAVLVAFMLIPLLFFVVRREQRLEYIYRSDAEVAFQENDQALAVICFDRLVKLRPNDQDRMQLANWLRETGQLQRSESILNSLAPEDARGYGPAHLLFAERIMESETPTTAQLAIAINHLKFARETMSNGGEVDFLLAKCFWATGAVREALTALRDAALGDPAYYYELFVGCRSSSVLPAASTSAKLAGEYLQPVVAQNPLDRKSRRRLVEVQIWLNQFDRAEAVLRQGMKVDPEGDWHEVLAEAYLAQFRQTRSEGLGLEQLLTFLEKAVTTNPESPEAIRELTDFAADQNNPRIEQILEGVLTSGRHNALVHFVIGSRKLQARKPDVDSGLFHMKRAFELNNDLAFAANNLAYHELLRENGDIEAGLRLINDVLQQQPDAHAFRETRGQLLTRLGRFEEALSDLEYALAKYPNEQLLHESLAQCYQELGQGSLGERHADKARRIAEREAEAKRAAKIRGNNASPLEDGIGG